MKILKKILFTVFLIYSITTFADQNMQNQMIQAKSNNWKIYPLMSVEDHSKKNHFRLVGTPDGLGVEKEDNFKIKVYMNHEIANDKGIVRTFPLVIIPFESVSYCCIIPSVLRKKSFNIINSVQF